MTQMHLHLLCIVYSSYYECKLILLNLKMKYNVFNNFIYFTNKSFILTSYINKYLF